MLDDFFTTNGPTVKIENESDLVELVELAEVVNKYKNIRSFLYFPDSWPKILKKMEDCKLTNVSLSKTNFKNATFKNCVFEDCLFIGSTFSDVEFHKCIFINCNFYKCKFNECYLDPSSIHLDKKYRTTAANMGVYLYQQLFENSSKSSQYNFSMKADIEFRKWKRWQLRYDELKGHITVRERLLQSALSHTYEWLTGFGYKPMRFAAWTLVMFTLASLINMLILPGLLVTDQQPINNLTLVDSAFYTYSMMTALGFSTILPLTGFAKLLAVSEALIGIGWLGIFTSLLVKRFIK